MQIFKLTGTIVIAAALVFSAVGCVKVKRKTSFTQTDSPVIYHTFVAVDDWSEWAAEIATRIEKAINDREDLDKKPIYMRPPNDRAFATGFYSLLHTELISRGLQVSVEEEDDMIVLSYATLPVVADQSELVTASSEARLIGSAGDDTLEDEAPERNSMLDSFPQVVDDSDKPVILSVGMSYNNRYVMHASSILRVAADQQGAFVTPYERGYYVKEFPTRTIKVSGE